MTALDFYFAPKRFERDGRLYRALGVGVFRQVILATAGAFVLALRKKEALYTYFVTSPLSIKSVRRTEAWSRFNEVTHIALIFVTYFIARAIYQKGYMGGVVFLGFVILLNVYLVLLQRYNRVRLVKMMEVLEQRAPREVHR